MINPEIEKQFDESNLDEVDTRRRETFSSYFRLAELTARLTNQPILEVIKEDFAQAIGVTKEETDPHQRIYVAEMPDGKKLVYDPDRNRVLSPFLPAGTAVTLSRTEGLYLEMLIKNPHRLVTQQELAEAHHREFGQQSVDINSTDELVRVSLYRLRKRLGIQVLKGEKPPLIQNIPGKGYILIPNSAFIPPETLNNVS